MKRLIFLQLGLAGIIMMGGLSSCVAWTSTSGRRPSRPGAWSYGTGIMNPAPPPPPVTTTPPPPPPSAGFFPGGRPGGVTGSLGNVNRPNGQPGGMTGNLGNVNRPSNQPGGQQPGNTGNRPGGNFGGQPSMPGNPGQTPGGNPGNMGGQNGGNIGGVGGNNSTVSRPGNNLNGQTPGQGGRH